MVDAGRRTGLFRGTNITVTNRLDSTLTEVLVD